MAEPLATDEMRRRLALAQDRQQGIGPDDSGRVAAINQWLPFSTNRPGSASWVTEGRNPQWAVPEVLQGGLLGVAGAADAPRTGSLTPELQASLLAGSGLTGGLLAPRGSLAAGGSFRSYHGSPVTDIPPGQITPSARGPLGPAVYSSPNESVAQRYAGAGGHIYEREVKVDDIFHGMRVPVAGDINPYQVWRDQAARLAKVVEPDKKAAVAALFEKLDPTHDGARFFRDLSVLYGSQEKAQELLKSAGYKGVSAFVDGPEVAWFGKQGIAAPSPIVPGASVQPNGLSGHQSEIPMKDRVY